MKKRLLLILALVGCFVFASAQKKQTVGISPFTGEKAKKSTYTVDFSKIEKKTESIAFSVNDLTEALKAPQAGLEYTKPAGTYHGSFFKGTTGSLSANYPLIFGKAATDWIFVASGGTNYTWTVNTNPMNANPAGNGIYNMPVPGFYYLPKVQSGTESYIWHQQVGNQVGAVSDQLHYISMVDPWKDSDSQGFGNLSGFSDYGYGTGLVNGKKVIECVQIYDAPQAPLYIESVNGAIFSLTNNPLPGTNHLTCTIYPVGPDGKITWTSPLAEGDCYREDLEDWGLLFSDGTKAFNAPFHFYAIDPISGLESEIDLIVSTAFAVSVTWTDGADFGFIWGDSDSDGRKSIAYDIDGSGWIFSAGPSEPIDIYLDIKAAMTSLFLDDRIASISFPIEGGYPQVVYTGVGTYSNVILNSTFSFEEEGVFIDEETVPNWISISEQTDESDPETGDFDNAISIVLSATANTGATRSAAIKVNSHGTIATINVTQTGGAGIVSVANELTQAVRKGNDFVLTYPASVTSVSAYNVAGQRVGEYKLNTTGTYTLPASDLANGVYVLRFNNGTSVKVLK
jgi:hypothetical protein